MTADPGPRSPNHGERLGGGPIDMLVLHYTGMRSEDGAIDWLCRPQSQVSCHWFVREDGRVHALVDEDRRAWHAGVSFWRGVSDVNSRSIGIEIANPGHEFGYRPFPDPQIAAVIALCRAILTRHPIPARNVVAHSDIAPARKEDPGELFPWDRLAAAGVGLHVPPDPSDDGGPALAEGDHGPAVAALQRQLAAYGYGVAADGLFSADTAAVVRAFQRHFRPARVDGRADPGTIRTLARLLESVPD